MFLSNFLLLGFNYFVPRSESKTRENNRGGSRILHKRGAPTPWGERQHIILPNFPKICIKLKKIWAVEGVGGGLEPPIESQNEMLQCSLKKNNVSLKKNNILFFMETNKENFPL